MDVIVHRILMPSEIPRNYSRNKPRMTRNATGWRKCQGYIIPVDAMDRIAPNCVFYLGSDGLWYSRWVAAQWWQDEACNPLYWRQLRKAIESGNMVTTNEQGMDYYTMLDVVKRAYGKSYGTTIKPLSPAEIYAEFGAECTEEKVNHINTTTDESGTVMVLTMLETN